MQANCLQTKSSAPYFGAHLPLRRLLNLAILTILYPAPLLANPEGAQIISGQVSINNSTPGVTTITNSPNAIIHWQNFNIAQNEITRFIQQNGQSAVLNRIIGENPSAILGQLASNGKVFLINPNGIVFGAGSVIDTQGLVASSLNLSDQDFRTGNYHFIAGSGSGNGAGNIVNEGIIRAGKDGNIILIAPSIQNNGIIKSDGGQITLAAGQELVLTSLDDPEIRFAIQAPTNAVLNLGTLLTQGGAVNVFANSITHSGDINADSVTVDAQGRIRLVAEQDINLTQGSTLSANNSHGDAGTIHVDSKTGTTSAQGVIEARATQTGKGGDIALLGERVGVLDQARLNANGAQGGGQVLVGGDRQGKNPGVHNAKATYLGADTRISADAGASGNGGKVIAWSDQATRAYGQISAKGGAQSGNGGFVETSGQWLDTSGVKVDASAARGKSGEWLLDPNNITIQAAGTDTHVGGEPNWSSDDDSGILTTGSIESALNNGTSITVTTSAGGANTQAGDITVASDITKSAGGDAGLTLNAHNNINIDANIKSTAGKLDLTLTPDSNGAGGGNTTINKSIDLNSGTLTLNGASTQSATSVIKNASITVSNAGNSELNGILANVETVTIEPNATLTVNHGNTDFNGVFKNSGTLNINAYFVMRALELDGGLLSGSGAVTVTEEFEFNAGKLAGSGLFTTAANAVTTLDNGETVYLGKNWNNLGTIDWQGAGGLAADNSNGGVTFNNMAGGVLNVSAPAVPTLAASGTRQLDMATFNNKGVVNLTSGELKILSPGYGDGDYNAAAGSSLQFSGTRYFNPGALVNSAGTVTFANGTHTFLKGSGYNASQTEVVDGGELNFYTGAAVALPVLTLNSGTLGGADNVTVSNQFNFHAGALAGGGVFTTAAGSATTLADVGAAYLDKRWDNLGTIQWQGSASLGRQNGGGVFNNLAGGVINVGHVNPAGVLEIDTARFNNAGTLNLSSGMLRILANGADTGHYNVIGSGQLQFWNASRSFNGATIDSANTLQFANGANYFNTGSNYNAFETFIDGATVTFRTGATVNMPTLTLGGNGTLTGSDSINVSSALRFFSGLMSGSGKLTTAIESRSLLAEGHALLYMNWDNYGIVSYGSGVSNPKATPRLGLETPPVKQWNNYGVINWQGDPAPASNVASAIILNNRASGVFNISSPNASSVRELNTGAFNNQGTVNLSSGVLRIYSPGADTGSYNVTDAGRLQFWNGSRAFNSGANIASVNPVSFVNSINLFNAGSRLTAPNTILDGATVSFNNGAVLNRLTMTGGTLNNTNSLTVNGLFNWSGGTVAGPGAFRFANGFNYSAGAMLATGSVDITGATLRLPAMPSISRLSARATGDLVLTGDIAASGAGAALTLVAGNRFDNSIGAGLATPNGRWLVYADHPDSATLGGLTAAFKHYGCTNNALCNDGFDVLATSGNGLLYHVIPVLFVTPYQLTSVYGDPANFTASYSGFIDGDTAATSGLSGAPTFTASGGLSGAGYYNAGGHDVAYAGGLANSLGYQFKDNAASLNEWTVTPRDLTIVANPASKFYGESDPLFSYNVSGLLRGDNLAGALGRVSGENVGHYPMTQGSLAASPNYRVRYTTANLQIKEADDVDSDDAIQESIHEQQNTVVVLANQADIEEHEVNEHIEHVKETSDEHSKRHRPRQCK